MTLPALKTFGISDEKLPHENYTGPMSQAISRAMDRMYENEVFTGDANCPMHFYGVGECICINNPVRN